MRKCTEALSAPQTPQPLFGVSSGACRQKRPLRGAQAIRNGLWRADRDQMQEGRHPKETAPSLRLGLMRLRRQALPFDDYGVERADPVNLDHRASHHQAVVRVLSGDE